MTNPYYTPCDRSIYMPHIRMPLTTADQPDHLPFHFDSSFMQQQQQQQQLSNSHQPTSAPSIIYEDDETMIPLKSMNDLSEKQSIAADSRLYYASEVSYSINKKLYSKAKKKHILEQL